MSPVRFGIVGASGRMGRAIVRLAVEAGDSVVAAVGVTDVGRDIGELSGVGPLGVAVTSELSDLLSGLPEVVIDFSVPATLPTVCALVSRSGASLVSGTTGLGPEAKDALDTASKAVAVLWEPNMSVGVHVLTSLVRQAARLLGEDFDVEVVEAHHRRKVDAPSGTALRLVEAVQAERQLSPVYGREGRPGARPADEIALLAMRGGDVVGDHHVHFLGMGERLELTHRATSRDVFASGALRAGRALRGRPPGRYHLADIL